MPHLMPCFVLVLTRVALLIFSLSLFEKVSTLRNSSATSERFDSEVLSTLILPQYTFNFCANSSFSFKVISFLCFIGLGQKSQSKSHLVLLLFFCFSFHYMHVILSFRILKEVLVCSWGVGFGFQYADTEVTDFL